ncbi:MAG: hypothetical protein RLZZ505_223 [Verrucomicrobiota bacterium]
MNADRKPYLEAWLRRTGRELSSSGRLSEAALILSRKKGGDSSEWAERLRRILEREEDPGFELLTEIDSILARPARRGSPAMPIQDLFD